MEENTPNKNGSEHKLTHMNKNGSEHTRAHTRTSEHTLAHTRTRL